MSIILTGGVYYFESVKMSGSDAIIQVGILVVVSVHHSDDPHPRRSLACDDGKAMVQTALAHPDSI